MYMCSLSCVDSAVSAAATSLAKSTLLFRLPAVPPSRIIGLIHRAYPQLAALAPAHADDLTGDTAAPAATASVQNKRRAELVFVTAPPGAKKKQVVRPLSFTHVLIRFNGKHSFIS